jgi:hypothetical protein
MADITITAANVVKGSGAQTSNGTAGASITAGQSIYLDSATSTLKLADADASATTAQAVGIALHAAASGQPLQYLTGGLITIGGTVVAGQMYGVSATAGGIAPWTDLTGANGARPCKLGYATTTGILNVLIEYTGVTISA